jgi:hypothetical protein
VLDVVRRSSHGYGPFGGERLPNGIEHLQGKPHPVLKGAAKFVGAVIGQRGEKLV